jgi:predicted neuraminidase
VLEEWTFNTSPADPAAQAGPLAWRATAIFEALAGTAGCHAPTITAFADGELLAAWYAYGGPGELDDAALYSARRGPGEPAWSAPVRVLESESSLGNPVLYAEGERVWLFYAVVSGSGWSTATIAFRVSEDRGGTWSGPQRIAGPLGANVRYPPIRTLAGELLLPAYDDLLQRALFFVSLDGQAWSLRFATAPLSSVLQPALVQLENGWLAAVFRNGAGDELLVSASADDGRTWAAPRDGGFANPGSPACLLRLADGRLALILNDAPDARQPLSITFSADDGVGWSEPEVLVNGTGEYAYPAAVQTRDGILHIVYSHARRSIGHLEVEL